jgi:inosine-uridine nucleoside N-ribohydrolase
MQKIILDTDIGSEMTDAATLCIAATATELDLLAVTTVTHDTIFRATTAKHFLSLLNKDIPVAAGAGSQGAHTWEKAIIFPNGYEPASLDGRLAEQVIVDVVNQYPGEVILLGIGTLTNIAKALELDPMLSRKTKELLLMGGMIEAPTVKGKQVPRGFEYNFCNDNTAATSVVSAGFNLTILPGDVTFHENDPWTDEQVQSIAEMKHPAVGLLSRLQQASMKVVREGLAHNNMPQEFAQYWINDELLVAYVLNPKLYKTRTVHISWRLEGKYPIINFAENGYPAKIITEVNYRAVKEFILKKLSDL